MLLTEAIDRSVTLGFTLSEEKGSNSVDNGDASERTDLEYERQDEKVCESTMPGRSFLAND